MIRPTIKLKTGLTVFISFFLFLITINSVNAVTELDNCTNITSPGYYELNTSIINSGNLVCILINSSDVSFNGNSFLIDGIDAGNSIGLSINQYHEIVVNVTVFNVIISDWWYGLRTEGLVSNDFYTIYDNILYSNVYGVYNNYKLDNSFIRNNTFFSSSYGIYSPTSGTHINYTVNNNNIINASVYSIYFNDIDNMSFFNNFLNGTNYYVSTSNNNNWNTTLQSETNIIGGSLVGGNYWGKTDGTGFSDICDDSDNNGICNAHFSISAGNIDYTPLSYGYNETNYTITLENIVQEDYDDCEDCRHLTLYYYQERNDITSLSDVKSCLESWPGWTFSEGIDAYFGNYIKTDTYGCGAQRYIEEECNEDSFYITSDYVIWRMDLNHTWAFANFIYGQYRHELLSRQVRTIERSGCGLELNYMGVNNSHAIGWNDNGYISGNVLGWEFGNSEINGTAFNYQSNNYQWNGFRTWHTTGTTSYLINDALLWYSGSSYVCNDEIEYMDTYSSTTDAYLSVGNNTLHLEDNACFDFKHIFTMQIENNYRNINEIYPDVNDYTQQGYIYGSSPYNIIYLYSLPLGISAGFNIMIYEPVWNEDYYDNENINAHISVYNKDVDLRYVEYYANDNSTPFRNITNIYCSYCSLNDFFEINFTRDGFNTGNNQNMTVIAYNSTDNISKTVYFNILPFTNNLPSITINTPISTDYENNTITLDFKATDRDGTIDKVVIWKDGTIYKDIKNIDESLYTYTENFLFDDNPHDFLIDIWDNDKGWAFASVSFTTGMIIDFNILSPLTFTGADTYNIGNNLTIAYEIIKHPYLLNYMEFYVNDILINNISEQLYFTFDYEIDTNFSTNMNNLKFRCYYGDSNNYIEKVSNVFINPYFQVQVLNGITFEPVDNVKVDFYEYLITPSLYRFRVIDVESIGDYIETSYTNFEGITTFYDAPDTYLFKLSKTGFEERELTINEDVFGILYQTILNPITTNIYVEIDFIIKNSTNNIILSQIELTDLVSPSNTYTFYSNVSELITAGTYSITIIPIGSNLDLYKTHYSNIELTFNITHTIILENIGSSNRVNIQTLRLIDSTLISNIMVNIRKDDIFLQSIYKPNLEPLSIFLDDGNYSFGGTKDNYRLSELIKQDISSDTNINIFFREITAGDYITVTIAVFDTSNQLINDSVLYRLYDVNLSNFVKEAYFSGGTVPIAILSDVSYKMILSAEGFQDKEIFFAENIDSYFRIVMYRTGESPDIPPETEDSILSDGLRLFFINVYYYLVITTGGGLVLGIVLMLVTLWSLNNGTQITPEKTQLSFLLIEAIAFTLIGLFPTYFGILAIIIIALFLSKQVYPSLEHGITKD